MNATDVATLLPKRRPKVLYRNGFWFVWYAGLRIRRYHTSSEAHRFAQILAAGRSRQA